MTQNNRSRLLIINADTDRAEYNDENLANYIYGILFDDEVVADNISLVTYNAHQERFPQEREQFDGIIITGSGTNSIVSERDSAPWVGRLIEMVRRRGDSGTPILGVCFGHQILAQAYEGIVQPIGHYLDESKIYEFGYPEITLTSEGRSHPLFSGIPQTFRANESHRNRVVELPRGGLLLAENSVGIQAFGLDDYMTGIQFHPEVHVRAAVRSLERRLENAQGQLRQDITGALGRVENEYQRTLGNPTIQIYRNFVCHYVIRGK